MSSFRRLEDAECVLANEEDEEDLHARGRTSTSTSSARVSNGSEPSSSFHTPVMKKTTSGRGSNATPPPPGGGVRPPLSLEVDVDALGHNGHENMDDDDEDDVRNGGMVGGDRHERVSSGSGASARLLEQSPRPAGHGSSTKFERSKSASFTLPRPPRGDRDRGDRHAAGSPVASGPATTATKYAPATSSGGMRVAGGGGGSGTSDEDIIVNHGADGDGDKRLARQRTADAAATKAAGGSYDGGRGGGGGGGSRGGGDGGGGAKQPLSLLNLLCCLGGGGGGGDRGGGGGGGGDRDDRRYGARVGRCPVTPPQFPSGVIAPAQGAEYRGKKTLVLDLDETLVHSSFKPIPNADFILPVEIDQSVASVYVMKRPYVDEFLECVGQLFEVVVFTASLSKYADPLLDILDRKKTIQIRLFRGACCPYEGTYVKDLSRLDRELRKTIIIDNSPNSYLFHPDHAIGIKSYIGQPLDTELKEFIPFMRKLSEIDDVTKVLSGSILTASEGMERLRAGRRYSR